MLPHPADQAGTVHCVPGTILGAGASIGSVRYVDDLARLFFAYAMRGLAPSTVRTYRLYLKKFCDRFGSVPIENLNQFAVFAWISEQHGWKSSSTFATVDRCIKRLFNWAKRFGIVDHSPVAGLPTPRESIRRDWKDREFVRVVKRTTPAMKRFLYFMAWTGSRPGEVRLMTWEDVDWQRNCVVLGQHKTVNMTRQPKPRTIIMVPVVERLLRWIQTHRNFGRNVFLNDHEKPWTATNICRRLDRIRRKSGLPKEVKPYGLRHLFASNAVRRGLDIKSLSLLLGHESVRHSERYVHLHGDTSHLMNAALQATGKTR